MLVNGRTALAAGGSNNNFFAGSAIEYMPADGFLSFGFTTGDLAAITISDTEVDIICGMELIATNFMPRALGVTPGVPELDKDFLLSCPALAGDRIIGKVRNLDAANASALYWTVIHDES